MFKRMSIGLLIILAIALGVTGAVLAQDEGDPDPQPYESDVCPYGGACGGPGMGGYGYHGAMPEILAGELGLTAEALFDALDAGQTLPEIAAAQGIEMADLVAGVMAPRLEYIEQAVADGHLTREQADWMIKQMTENMTQHLESFGLDDEHGGYGPGGCGMMGGSHGYGHGGGMHGRGHHGGGMGVPFWSAPSDDL